MAGAGKIIRRTIHAFLQDYHRYASIAALLIFPVSASILLSQALSPPSSSALVAIQARIHALFHAAGFPVYADFFPLLDLKISQTIFSSVFALPFMLTFLVLAKAAVIRIVCQSPQNRQGLPPFSSFLHLYRPLVQTHICNYLTILSTSAAIFSLLFIAFNVADVLQVSSTNTILTISVAGGLLYSVILAHVLVACNLAVVISGVEGQGGYIQILKAFLFIRGRASTAISLALPANLGMAAVEALFQYRVMRAYYMSSRLQSSAVWEAFSIAYIHSLFVVLDIITSCMFFKSCKWSTLPSWNTDMYNQADLMVEEADCSTFATSKCKELP